MDRPQLLKNERWEQLYRDAYKSVLENWPLPVESRFVDTDFGKTFVLSSGSEESPPLVLLHGAGVSSAMWRPNIEALSSAFRVYAVDTLWDMGNGEASVFPENYQEATKWFEQVLDGLGVSEVNLIGLSYGGFLSIRFSIDLPHRIRKLVVLSPAASLTNLSGKFVINALGMIIVPTRPRKICEALMAWATQKPIDQDLLDLWITGIRGIKIPTPIHKIPPMVFTDDELQSLKPPALLLMGEKEWTCKKPTEAVERFGQLVPKGQAEMLDEAGHIVSMDCPEVVNQRILAFLSRDSG